MAHTHYRTIGFVLKKQDRGEADQLFSVFTKDFGKVEVLGRAIRKTKSKLRAGIDLLYLSEIEFIQGKNYKTLTDAILIEKHGTIPETFELLAYFSDIVNLMIGREHKDEQIWGLLEQVFQAGYNELIKYWALWNLLKILGYTPELFSCADCHKKLLPEVLFFCPEDGGAICWQCNNKEKQSQEILVDTIKVLRLLLNQPVEIVNKLKVEKNILDNLETITDSYLKYLTSDLGGV